jgi:hypothetical protein
MRKPACLSLKPDIEEAARRWEAYYSGDIIDRPLVWVTAPRPGAPPTRPMDYRHRAMGDIDRAMDSARAVFRQVWKAVAAAARMDERGYYHQIYFTGTHTPQDADALLEWFAKNT